MKDFPVSLIKTVAARNKNSETDFFLYYFFNNLTEFENDQNVSPWGVSRGLCSFHPWSFLGPGWVKTLNNLVWP